MMIVGTACQLIVGTAYQLLSQATLLQSTETSTGTQQQKVGRAAERTVVSGAG